MSNCNIKIPFAGSATENVSKAKSAIIAAKGSFAGDDEKGEFKVHTLLGNITGSYNVENSVLILTVTHKPFLLTCKTLEKKLLEYVAPHVVA